MCLYESENKEPCELHFICCRRLKLVRRVRRIGSNTKKLTSVLHQCSSLLSWATVVSQLALMLAGYELFVGPHGSGSRNSCRSHLLDFGTHKVVNCWVLILETRAALLDLV